MWLKNRRKKPKTVKNVIANCGSFKGKLFRAEITLSYFLQTQANCGKNRQFAILGEIKDGCSIIFITPLAFEIFDFFGSI